MKKNVGKSDQVFRNILGGIVLALGIYYQSWWGVVGLIPLINATIGWCPFYVPFKLSTRKTKHT